jgi:hypothetical protein
MGRCKHHWQNKINQRLTMLTTRRHAVPRQSSADFPADDAAKVLIRDEGFPINVTF